MHRAFRFPDFRPLGDFLSKRRLTCGHVDQDRTFSCACQDAFSTEVNLAHIIGIANDRKDEVGSFRNRKRTSGIGGPHRYQGIGLLLGSIKDGHCMTSSNQMTAHAGPHHPRTNPANSLTRHSTLHFLFSSRSRSCVRIVDQQTSPQQAFYNGPKHLLQPSETFLLLRFQHGDQIGQFLETQRLIESCGMIDTLLVCRTSISSNGIVTVLSAAKTSTNS